jgi:hypothetical protein
VKASDWRKSPLLVSRAFPTVTFLVFFYSTTFAMSLTCAGLGVAGVLRREITPSLAAGLSGRSADHPSWQATHEADRNKP